MGYKSGYGGFVLFYLRSREIFISRHVTFHENVLPYPKNVSSTTHDWQYFSISPSPNLSILTDNTPLFCFPVIDDILPPLSIPHASPTIPISHRRPTRIRTAPSHLQDYVCNNLQSSTYPVSHYLTYDNLSANHASFILSLQSHLEPTTYVKVSKHECWKQAMQVELLALEKTGT